MNNRLHIIIFAVTTFLAHTGSAQQQYELNSGWKCTRASGIKQTGEEISKPSFSLKGWMPATVPGTVLTTLLNNKLIPDPFYGMNNKHIPDIYDVGRDYYTYWFVKDFDEKYIGAADVYLQFRGVNYKFDVYLNGHKINYVQERGMYLRHEYEISWFLAKTGHNRLAVIVYPPDSVGNPNGGQGGDGMIAHGITNQFTAGWDWIQPVHDRNTGIWDKVFIKKVRSVKAKYNHSVTILRTQVITQVPGKRETNGIQVSAIIKVKVTAEYKRNPELDVFDNGEYLPVVFEYEIGGRTIRTAPLNLKAYIIEPYIELPDLILENPKLWWPNGYGPQNLYHLKIRALINDTVCDEEDITIGIRQLDAVWNTHTQSRELRVNGQRIFLKGGNWIASDEMLRFSKERYDAEVRYHRDMNLNLIRVWGGGVTERPEFYDACDKYGILVMQDFWVSGDCNGRWDDPLKREDTTARRNYPDDHRLLLESMEDQVMMLRNHPSLAFWCGGNEIRPPADVLKEFRDKELPFLDNTRFFFEYSNDDSMSYHAGDGPYTIQPDSFFWSHRSWGFNQEEGSVGIGDYESLERFIPKENMVPPAYDTLTHKWKIDSVWKYHKYSGYDSAIEAYGHPKGAKDFAMKAQLVNYNQYRALTEGMASHMWDWYTGYIIWKTQNPWTAMVGQMYDTYLDPNACMYGVMEGCKPVHIMYDPVRKAVMIVNNTADTVKNLGFVEDVFSFDEHLVSQIDRSYNIPSNTCMVVDSLPYGKEFQNGGLLKLSLVDYGLHKYYGSNIYWFLDKKGSYDYLNYMIGDHISADAKFKNSECIDLTIKNKDYNELVFFNRISVVDKQTKNRILPVFFSDNYISLFPNEEKTIQIEYTPQPGMEPMVCIEGWNTGKQYIEVTK